MAERYNGHKDWQHWNVSLWISSDLGLYSLALSRLKRFKGNADLAASAMHYELALSGHTETPDGAKYTHETLLAALEGLLDD